jgi:S-adenosylmethionine hydrolase
VRLPWPEPRAEAGARVGSVVHVDRFGNLVTNLQVPDEVPLAGAVEVGGRAVPTGRTYSDVARGSLVALRGSSGLLEIACNGGSAAAALGSSEALVVVWRA